MAEFNKKALIAKDIARSTGVMSAKIALLVGTKSLGEPLIDKPELMSYLNTPVYDSLIFGYLNEKSRNNYIDDFGNTISYEPIRLVEVLISVQQTKNIVTTAVAGLNGTVKQYMSKGDYIINVEGRISGQYNPSTDNYEHVRTVSQFSESFARLIEICEIGYSLPITSRHLQLFGINQVVITDFNFPQREGNRNNQVFSILPQ